MDTKKLRQKILDLAIRGKLVPQDPNDEPASVLLERIRAEKERLVKEGKIKKTKASKTSDTPHYEQVPFEVPSSWVWITVSAFTHDLQYGTSEKSLNKGSVPVLRMGNITRLGSIDYSDLVYSSNEEDIKKYNLQKNDLLFNRTNSSEWVGKTAIFKSDHPAIYAGYLIRVRCIIVNPDYVNLVMNSSYHRDWCNQVKTDAVNQSNINAQKLSNLLIPIPPYLEQLRIVADVEHWFELIDTLESGKLDLQTSIKQAKSKILDLAIHGKLVPQNPADEPASELLKRINPKAEITCDNGQYGKIPEGWCNCRLCDVLEITMGQSPQGDSINCNEGIEFHQGKLCFSDKYLQCSNIFTTEPTKIAEVNSLLLCVRAPVGVVNITQRRICIGRGLCSLKPLYGTTLYYFYLLQTLKDNFESQSTGTTFKSISGDIVKKEIIPLPPLAEQHRIVAKIEELFSKLEQIEKSLEA